MWSSKHAAFAFSVILKVWCSFAVTLCYVTACSVWHFIIAMYCYDHRHLVCVAQLFGAFALLKATLSFVLSVRPSVRPSVHMEQLDSHWTDFLEIWYLSIFRQYLEKIQVSLKSDKNDGYFTWRPIYVFNHFRSVLLWMKNVSDKSCSENKKKTRFMFSNFFPRKSCRLWDNVKKMF